MTRAQAAMLPLSLSAHAAGAAGLLALSILPANPPPARATPAPPLLLPVVAMPVVAMPVLPRSRPPRVSPRQRRAAATIPSRPAVAPPAPVDPPAAPSLEGPASDGEPGPPGAGCLDCEIGEAQAPGAGDPGGGTAVDSVPVPIGGRIREPRKLRHVAPVYPEIARAARVQGVVVVECTVTPEGGVANARVLRGHPLLDASALRAVTQWAFTPTLLNGVPVPVIMTVTVKFELR
ncbi:MAG TPA: energy transducer TonB [Vicinamibacteria bacterium]|nr:energy transducer TonB [Vicinamibacteria bacterium]